MGQDNSKVPSQDPKPLNVSSPSLELRGTTVKKPKTLFVTTNSKVNFFKHNEQPHLAKTDKTMPNRFSSKLISHQRKADAKHERD